MFALLQGIGARDQLIRKAECTNPRSEIALNETFSPIGVACIDSSATLQRTLPDGLPIGAKPPLRRHRQ